MPKYRLKNADVSSISFGGIEHKVSDGLLQIDDQHNSVALQKHLTENLGAELADDPAAKAAQDAAAKAAQKGKPGKATDGDAG